MFYEHVAHGGDVDGPAGDRRKSQRKLMVLGQGTGEAVRQQKRHCGCPLSTSEKEMADRLARFQGDY